ncbi:MAG: oligosaccharide flippase family protein [Ignavibacteria bacterium]|nr:oligosaccharide flippase family protein [Ignavibacteria bacterium]
MFVTIEITSFILIDLLSLHSHTAVMRWCANTKSEVEREKIISTAFFPLIIILSIVLFSFLPFTSNLSMLFFDTGQYSYYFYYLVFISFIAVVNQFSLSLLRFYEKSKRFLLINLARFATVVGLNVYLLTNTEMKIESIFISQLAGYFLVFVLSISFTLKRIKLLFDRKVFNSIIEFIWPLIISTFLILIMTNIDKYVIKFILGDSDVGLYTLGFRVASLINIVFIQSFQLGYLPYAYKKLNENNAKRFYSKVLTYYTLIITYAVLILAVLSGPFLIMISSSKEYFEASAVIPFILFSFIFKGMSFIFAMGFHFSKKTLYNIWTGSISLVIGVIFYIVAAKYIGIVGVAGTTCLVMILNTVLSYKLSQKIYPINYEVSKIITVLSLSVIFYIVIQNINFNLTSLEIIIKSILLLSFPFFLYLFKFYEPVELVTISRFWSEWRNPLKWKTNFVKFLEKKR